MLHLLLWMVLVVFIANSLFLGNRLYSCESLIKTCISWVFHALSKLSGLPHVVGLFDSRAAV